MLNAFGEVKLKPCVLESWIVGGFQLQCQADQEAAEFQDDCSLQTDQEAADFQDECCIWYAVHTAADAGESWSVVGLVLACCWEDFLPAE